jgi:hypothetical protein
MDHKFCGCLCFSFHSIVIKHLITFRNLQKTLYSSFSSLLFVSHALHSLAAFTHTLHSLSSLRVLSSLAPTHRPTDPLTHPLTHSPTHSPLTHSLTHPLQDEERLTHSPTHSLTHPLQNEERLKRLRANGPDALGVGDAASTGDPDDVINAFLRKSGEHRGGLMRTGGAGREDTTLHNESHLHEVMPRR